MAPNSHQILGPYSLKIKETFLHCHAYAIPHYVVPLSSDGSVRSRTQKGLIRGFFKTVKGYFLIKWSTTTPVIANIHVHLHSLTFAA